MKDMSDSVKLQFKLGILCLVSSYFFLIIAIVFVFLAFLVDALYFLVPIFGIFAFYISITDTINYFKKAIEISKKEDENKSIKRAMNKTLD